MREILLRFFLRKTPGYIDADYHRILSGHSVYYQRLEPALQKDFRLRLFHLLNILAFSPHRLPVVNREMRAVIGCAIIEITFGLKKFLPGRFTNIMVLPRRYVYPGYGQPFLGHIDYDRDALYFSWQDVRHGYLVPGDAVNVALHEWAHVLEVENRYNALFSRFFNQVDWKQWAQVAFEKMQVIRKKENSFLKSYGGANMSEMFAVCVETFFEKPEAFKAQLPDLYETMVHLLKQDPTRPGNPLLERRFR